jgi:hypothetical protein
LQAIVRYLREDDTHSRLICFFSPGPIEPIAKEQQSSGRGETIQGADSMELGKVDLRDEAQRPFAVAIDGNADNSGFLAALWTGRQLA